MTMEVCPAGPWSGQLQRLLEDIRGGLVDVVVVYKVDRLTRSLADFAKMVEIFDANGVSFVAVTQQFNTTTSMGRLTLNVLLSFAQFEREVTGVSNHVNLPP
jgi:site-specific DNA recombinase